MPSAPVVNVVTKYLLLNEIVSAADLFSVSDPDGDTITKYRFTDLSNSAQSGYFQMDGNRRPQGFTSEFASAQLAGFEFVAGSVISSERIRIEAFDGGLWSSPVELQIFFVRPNVNRPVVTANSVTMVESDYLNLNTIISAADPDGWPITQYYLRDASSSGGYLKLGNTVITQGTYRTYSADEFANLRYYAVLPNQVEAIEVFAYDGVEWSVLGSANITTRVNLGRPTTNYGSKNVGIDRLTTLHDIMGWFDSDGNQIKSIQVIDSNEHPGSGALVFNGNTLTAKTWHTIPLDEIGNLRYRGAGDRLDEIISYRVSDGKFWSTPSDLLISTLIRPILSYDPSVVEEDLTDIPARTLFTKADPGPAHIQFEIADQNPSGAASARLYLDGILLPANVVHSLTASQFNRLIIRTAQYEDRALDPLMIRVNNGLFWSDWERMELRTEPELRNILRSPESAPQPDIDGFNDWDDWLGSEVITYSFMQQFPDYETGRATADVWSRFTPQQRAGARAVFEYLEEVIDVDMQEVSDASFTYGGRGGVIRMGNWFEAPEEDDPDPPPAAYAFFPNDTVANPEGGDMWFNTFYLNPNSSWQVDTNNWFVFIHELGHALGMPHPFDGYPRLPQATDNTKLTVMSYTNSGPDSGSYMLYDLVALQSLYGANMNTRTGDSLYDFAGYFEGRTAIQRAIWDAGGVDTLSAAGMTGAATLDLRQGSFSSLGAVTNNIVIAFGVDIENAIGAAGNDNLTGNHLVNRLEGLAGRDTIWSNSGNDFMFGGAGNDLYIYRMGDDHDVINELASAGRDTLRIDLFAGLNSFSQDLSFRREGLDLIVDLTLEGGLDSNGTIRVINQKWGSWGVEILRFGTTNIDLTNIFAQTTTTAQSFQLTANSSTFGLLVAPV